MGRLPRIYEAGVVYEVTSRTIQGRFLLLPGKQANDLVAGAIGRAQWLYPSVQVYGVVALSNHITWLMLSSQPAEIPAFIGYVNQRISAELGRIYDWPGVLWERPARPIPIADDRALLERFDYLLAQGVKENLVERAEDWPGVSCVPSLLRQRSLRGTWYERDRARRASFRKTPPPLSEFGVPYEVRFSRLPGFEHLSDEAYAAFVAARLDYLEERARRKRQGTGTRCLGVRAILSQDPHHRPTDLAHSPAPRCHASSTSSRQSFWQRFRELVDWYRASAEKLKQGVLSVVFPPGSFPPRFPTRANPASGLPVVSFDLADRAAQAFP